MSATSAVASFEEASATTTSANRPLAAAGTSAERVGTRVRSDSLVAMIALSMEPWPLYTVATISCGVPRLPHEIGVAACNLCAAYLTPQLPQTELGSILFLLCSHQPAKVNSWLD